MLDFLYEHNAVLLRNDQICFEFLFRIYSKLLKGMMPFIADKPTFDVISQIVVENRNFIERLSGEGVVMTLNSANEFLIEWSNDFDDCLNKWQCKCDNNKPNALSPILLAVRPLLNLSIL